MNIKLCEFLHLERSDVFNNDNLLVLPVALAQVLTWWGHAVITSGPLVGRVTFSRVILFSWFLVILSRHARICHGIFWNHTLIWWQYSSCCRLSTALRKPCRHSVSVWESGSGALSHREGGCQTHAVQPSRSCETPSRPSCTWTCFSPWWWWRPEGSQEPDQQHLQDSWQPCPSPSCFLFLLPSASWRFGRWNSNEYRLMAQQIFIALRELRSATNQSCLSDQ